MAKMQIYKESSAAPCQSYLCRNRVSYGIGKSKAYSFSNTHFCEGCMKEMGDVMPIELIEDNPGVIELKEKIATLEKEIQQKSKEAGKIDQKAEEAEQKSEDVEQAKPEVTKATAKTPTKGKASATKAKGGK